MDYIFHFTNVMLFERERERERERESVDHIESPKEIERIIISVSDFLFFF